jgi:cyclic-di-GMP phosphodiesterase TipF (flagellum assembly factor)
MRAADFGPGCPSSRYAKKRIINGDSAFDPGDDRPMTRVATILVMSAMAVIAISLAVVLVVRFDVPTVQATTAGICLLLAMALAHVQTMRRRDRRWMEGRIAEISAVAGDVNAEVDRMAQKLARVDGVVQARVREEVEPVAGEVEVLGHLMKQIAETLADLEISVDRRIGEVTARTEALRLAAPAARDIPRSTPSRPAIAAGTSTDWPVVDREPGSAQPPPVVPPPVVPAAAAGGRIPDPLFDAVREPVTAGLPPDGRVEPRLSETPSGPAAEPPPRLPTAFEREVEAAIRGERIEIHLQPIVTLPQRKVRHYEVLTRLRSGDGRLIPAAEFLPVAERRGLIARLDTVQVIRSFQILRRLTARNREIGLVINLSARSLADTAFFREFSSFLAQNRQLADSVQFEFTQASVREMGPLEAESLSALADLDFRFSLDNVTDLRMDVRTLVDRGFRTVKVSVDRLLGKVPTPAGDIHPADLSGHLQRQGVALVVDRIETEADVVDLLDYDVRFAQGFLFSAPRQVRPEILGAAPGAEGAARGAVR